MTSEVGGQKFSGKSDITAGPTSDVWLLTTDLQPVASDLRLLIVWNRDLPSVAFQFFPFALCPFPLAVSRL